MGITVLNPGRGGEKVGVLLKIDAALLARCESQIRGPRAPGLVKLLELGLERLIREKLDIVIDVGHAPRVTPKPRAPAKGKRARTDTPAAAAATDQLAASLREVAANGGKVATFSRKRGTKA